MEPADFYERFSFNNSSIFYASFGGLYADPWDALCVRDVPARPPSKPSNGLAACVLESQLHLFYTIQLQHQRYAANGPDQIVLNF